MKGIRNEITAHDSDRGRQHAVQGRAPAISSVTRSRKINVSALGQRVHSGVGAAGAMDANVFATNLRERFFQVVLNAVAIRLALPARKWRAVIGDDQLEPRRHRASGNVGKPARLQFIQIPLQDHLRGDLVDDVARIARPPTAIAQGTVRGGRRQTFVPCHDFAGQHRLQFFRERQRVDCAFADASVHVPR